MYEKEESMDCNEKGREREGLKRKKSIGKETVGECDIWWESTTDRQIVTPLSKFVYLVIFQISATDTAPPARNTVLGRCKGASVSGEVKSHTSRRPPDQGISVEPSGLLPSPQTRASGSKIVGCRYCDTVKVPSPEAIHSMMAWLLPSTFHAGQAVVAVQLNLSNTDAGMLGHYICP